MYCRDRTEASRPKEITCDKTFPDQGKGFKRREKENTLNFCFYFFSVVCVFVGVCVCVNILNCIYCNHECEKEL